jgi:hypothetical protein
MSPIRAGEMQRARKVRDALAAQFLGDPAVRMIDIAKADERIAVRIHVDPRASPAACTAFPEHMNGIPVIVIAADYRPE